MAKLKELRPLRADDVIRLAERKVGLSLRLRSGNIEAEYDPSALEVIVSTPKTLPKRYAATHPFYTSLALLEGFIIAREYARIGCVALDLSPKVIQESAERTSTEHPEVLRVIRDLYNEELKHFPAFNYG